MALKPGGKLISAVSIPDAALAAKASVRTRFFVVAATTTVLHALTRDFDAGRLAPRVGAVLPLADARLALARVEGREPKAKSCCAFGRVRSGTAFPLSHNYQRKLSNRVSRTPPMAPSSRSPRLMPGASRSID